MPRLMLILAVVFLSILKGNYPIIFYPLELLVTGVHEICHGIAAIATGGSITSIDFQSHLGVTYTTGGFYPIISMAGYVGSSLIGTGLLISHRNFIVRLLLVIFFIITLLLSIYYTNKFSLYGLLFIAEIILLNAGFFYIKNINLITFFMSAIFVFEFVEDMQMLLFFDKYTDSYLLASYLGLPWLSFPISLLYAIISVYIWYRGLMYLKKDLAY